MEISDLPKLINNINERVADDLKERLSSHSRISIAAASFSIYAFEALKKELEQVEALQKKVRAEKRFAMQMELNTEARALKQEVARLTEQLNNLTK